MVKASGGSMDHVKILFDRVGVLVDGFIDGYLSEEDLEKMTISLPQNCTEKCNSCGIILKQ